MWPARNASLRRRFLRIAGLLLALVTTHAAAVNTSAVKDLTCAGYRDGSSLNCTAGEFTVGATLSAAPGTPPFCMAGNSFEFVVDVDLSGSNADRYDIAFWAGQQGNDPGATTAGNICSVATFPTTPAPWIAKDTDACGDYEAAGATTNRVDKIKVVCAGDAVGNLQVPYLVSYWQNSGNVCTGPADVLTGSTSKCNKGTATVSGAIKVVTGGWVDITKQTNPDGNTESFSFTATGPAGSKLSALTGATLTDTGATGGTYTPADIASATNSTTFTLKDGETARVFMGIVAAGRTLNITETALSGWDPTAASITCSDVSGAGSPITTVSTTNRTVDVTLNTANFAKKCTITNTKRARLQVTKVSNGDVGTFTFTGNNTWSSQNITTVTSGVGVTGATQVLPQSVATTLTESAAAGYRVSGINCTGIGAGGNVTYDTSARTAALDATAMAPGVDVTCTYTNQRTRPLTVTKSLSPGTDAGKFVMNANGTTGTEGGNGATASATVDVGATATFAETAGTGTNLANYTSSYSCNTTPAATTGNATSGSLTMPNADITCTLTNTRRSASLTLRKLWANAISGNKATVTSSGFINNATSGESTSTGNNSTSGSAVTVYSGEAGTISESFGAGDPANYNASLACTNTSGLSGTTLTVAPADNGASIVCTYTNARKYAELTLRKSWVDANPGDKVTVTSSGFANNATSGESTSAGTNITTGTPVYVYAAESGTISESFGSGDPAAYTSTLSCSGTSGLSGSTLTVSPADTAIICTFVNEALKPLLSVLKLSSVISDPINGGANAKRIPGALVSYTLRVTNSGPGEVDNNSLVLTDPIPSNLKLYVNDLGGSGSGPVTFTDGTPASGLSWTFTSLASMTDSIDFSNDNGATWTYVPVPDVNGFDTAVTHIRLRPQGTMNATGGGDPYFQLVFRVQVE